MSAVNKRLIIALSVALVLIFAFSSCKGDTKSEREEINIVCTNFAAYDFARTILGEKGSAELLLPPGTESHSYEPSPGDIIKITNCSLFICVGGESESWLNDVLDSIGKGRVNTLKMLECVSLLEEETVEGMETEEEHEHEEEFESEAINEYEGYDEHVWTSVFKAEVIAKSICDRIVMLDEGNAEYYKKNYQDFSDKLFDLDTDIRETVAKGKIKTLIFADRFPFRYFTEEYGLEYYAAFPGCSGMTEPGASTVSFLIDKAKELDVPCVFTIEFSKGLIAESITEGTDIETRLFHSCHNVSADDFKNGVSYLDLMRNNLENLKFALKSET